MERKTQREERAASRLTEVAAAITAAVSVAAVIGLERQTFIAIALPALAASAFVVLAGRRALEVRTIPIYIALGGPSGVGKTVFANVVSSRLSEGNSDTLSFVPETRTAQHVYRTISGLRRGDWPSRTGTDQIDRYRGRVELLYQPLLRRLVTGRVEFELEVGDSAGELWSKMAEEDFPPRLIDSTFFEYVGESSALLYFIDSRSLQSEPDQVADQVDDLLSTLQVLRSLEPRGSQRLVKPIGVVISKSDLLTINELTFLKETLEGDLLVPKARDLVPSSFAKSIEHLEHLITVMDRQARSFTTYIVSSIDAAQTSQFDQKPELIDPRSVEQPIEWSIKQSLKS